MAAKEERSLNIDGIRTKESYVGRKTGKKIVVVSVEQSFIKFHYVYDGNGSRMTADQELTRTDFIRRFCRASEKNSQEI